jgi:predicted AlkP superfamily phosphohydrolase/phosphomutase
MSAPSRLLILGLDGATWNVLDPMCANGVMPNLRALLSQSAHGVLRSCIPPVTTAAWTTLMTGAGPAHHGIFDHRWFDSASGQMRVNHSGRRRIPTFWHLLSDAGKQVVSLNVPGTFPPLPVNGIVVSGMDAPHLEAALQGAPAFAARLKAEVPDYTLRYFWKRVPQSLDELEQNAQATARSFIGRARGGLLADQVAPDWSVLMVQFQNLDPFQHRCWRFLDVDETGARLPDWNAAALEALRGLDQAIGLLVELAQKRGAMVLTASDHGFGPCAGRIHVNRILRDAGLAKSENLAGRIRRRFDRIAELSALHKQKNKDPEARTAAFDSSVYAQYPLDWNRTLGFAPHQDTAAMIYLNSTNRRPNAPLKTPRQIDDARNQIAMALAEARDPESNKPLFPEVISVADVYQLDPAPLNYPDLIAVPDETLWVRTKLAPGRAWVEPDPGLPGTHRREGIVALAGSPLPIGRHLRADLVDIAPTVLALQGIATPDWMEGKPLPGIAPGAETKLHNGQNPYQGPHENRNFEYSREDEAVIEQRLADLGYLE